MFRHFDLKNKKLKNCLVKIQKPISFLLIFSLITGWAYNLIPGLERFSPEVKVAEAANTKIRQEINVIDDYVGAASGSYATSSAIININPSKYTSATYYFEVVASTTSATDAYIYLKNATSSAILSTITANGTSYTRYRSTSTFTPSSAATDYVVVLGNQSVGKGIISARVIILQDAATITNTQTKIEIGSEVLATSSTATTPLSNPKYWYYDSDKWDGSPTFYAEATYKLTPGYVSSTTVYSTAATYTVTIPSDTYATSTLVELWGGGGAGGAGTTNPGGGSGGAGGAYARSRIDGLSGNKTLLVGGTTAGVSTSNGSRGATSTWETNVVVAGGGPGGGKDAAASSTGDTTGSVGDIKYAGGGGGRGVSAAFGTGYGAGGGGGAGSTGTGSSSSGAGVAGGATSDNGGAGGAKKTSAGVGNSGTQAGGGGSGGWTNATTNRAGGTGAAGMARITHNVSATTTKMGIALEECNYTFSSCSFKQMIVTGGSATTATLATSTTFTPTSGKNYRVVSSTTPQSGAVGYSYDIYNAKIVVDQTSPSKLQPQYLLANKYTNSSTGLMNYDTLASSTEWSNVTNTYVHQIDSSTDASDSAKLQSNPNVTPTDITDSTATGANRATSTASGFTMPTGTEAERTIDVNVLNSPIYASRILVNVSVLAAPAPPTITPNTEDAYDFGGDTTPTLEFTGTDPNSDDIRYKIEIDTNNRFDSASTTFTSLNQTARNWSGMAIDSSNQNVYATTGWGSDLYKQTAGTGDFAALSQESRSWNGIAVDSSNQNAYAIVYNGDIYKQTAGTGDFAALGQTSRNWNGIAVDSSNQNVYATVEGGDIYKQTAGTGDFVALSQTSRTWEHIAIDSSNQNVYATVWGGDIYKQTAGTGNFVALSQTSRNWYGITVDSSNHNVYAVANGGDIYKQIGGTGDFLPLGQTSRSWAGISVDSSNQNVYAAVDSTNNIYKQTSGVQLRKISGTDDGFANTVDAGDTDPFTSGQKASFTVQGADALETGTYYWHARAIDPNGSNVYSTSWTTTRSFTVTQAPTISGTVYSSEGGSNIGSGKTVKVYKNGTTSVGSDTTDANGAWSVNSSPGISSSDVVTVYLDGDDIDANMVFVSDGTDEADINLFGNALIVRHDTGTAITNANLQTGMVSGEDDMIYSTSTTNAITLDSNAELHVWTSDTYTAGGTLTTAGTGGLHLDDSSTATLNMPDNVIAGNVTIDTGATLNVSEAITISGNLSVTGSLAGAGHMTLSGEITGSGSIVMSDGTDLSTSYLYNVKQVQTGNSHACAVTNAGNVYCWGKGDNGILGDNNTTAHNAGTPVRVLKGAAVVGDTADTNYLGNVAFVNAGFTHTCASTYSGNVYCWGRGDDGQLGDNNTDAHNAGTPVRVLKGAATTADTADGSYLGNVANVTAGGDSPESYTCVFTNSDNIYCWGDGVGGKLGDNNVNAHQTGVPVRVLKGAATAADTADTSYLGNANTIGASSGTTCASTDAGNVYCWGIGDNGKLGDNNTTAHSSGVPVRVLKGAAVASDIADTNYLGNIATVSTEFFAVCALSNAGNPYCWGTGLLGGLGDNNVTDHSSGIPVRVVKGAATAADTVDTSYLGNVKTLVNGGLHGCAATNSENMYCWGYGLYGCLRDNDASDHSTGAPIRVLKGAATAGDTVDTSYLGNVRLINGGGYLTCASTYDYNTYCWGQGDNGQIGDNNVTVHNVTTPSRVLSGAADSSTSNIFKVTGTGGFGGSGNWQFSRLTFGSSGTAATTTSLGSGSITVGDLLLVYNGQTLDAGVSKTWNISSSTEPFGLLGTLLASSSSFVYQGTSNATVTPTTYYNLEISPPSGSPTYLVYGGGSSDWYSTGGTWGYRKKITIDNTKVSGTGDLTDFPILVDLTDSGLQANAQSDGGDIVFTSSDGITKLSHEIEIYTTATGRLTAWVNIPTLDGDADTSIYMYYGNADVADQWDTPDGNNDVWNSSYKAVYHFGNGTVLNLTDSTSNNNDGTAYGNTAATTTDVKIGGGVAFEGNGDYVVIPHSTSLNIAGSLTLETWARITTYDANRMIITKPTSGANGGYSLNYDATWFNMTTWKDWGWNNDFIHKNNATMGSPRLLVGRWDAVADPDTAIIFVDGASQSANMNYTSTPPAMPTAIVSDLYLGQDGSSGRYYYGTLDELRISAAPRSDDWVATEFNNQSATSTFYTVFSQETLSSGLNISNNFTLGGAGNVTVDANTKDPAINITGNLTIGSGDVFSGSNASFLTIGGNLSNSGTFTHNNGTTTLNTLSDSIISSTGNMSFHSLNITTPGKTVKFSKHTANVPTFSFDYLFTVTGLNGNPIFIESDTPRSQWLVDFNVGQTAITNVYVKDSACAVGSLSVSYSITNSGRGNNGSCWNLINRGATSTDQVTSTEQGTGWGTLQTTWTTRGGSSGGIEDDDGGGGDLCGGVPCDGDPGGGGGAVEGASTINMEYIINFLEEFRDELIELKNMIVR